MDLHPKEPWMLVSLYNGNVHIWSHESQVGGAVGVGSVLRCFALLIMIC